MNAIVPLLSVTQMYGSVQGSLEVQPNLKMVQMV